MIVRQRESAWCHRFSASVLALAIAATILFVWRKLTPIVVTLASMTGCVMTGPLGGGMVNETLPAGDYWVEARAEELAAFALPGTPQNAAAWSPAAAAGADWFAGAGVYRLGEGDEWAAVSVSDSQSLDDVLQTWDVRR